MRLDWKLNIFNRYLEFKYYKEYNIGDAVVGINSNLSSNSGTELWFENHFLMLDYDDSLSLSNLIVETKRLQKKFNLPDAHIFESSFAHYHVIYFGVCRDYFDCLKVVHDTPACYGFKTWRMIREEMTLRITPKRLDKKITLVHIVYSPLGKYDDHVEDNFIIKREIDSIRKFVLANCIVSKDVCRHIKYEMEVLE